MDVIIESNIMDNYKNYVLISEEDIKKNFEKFFFIYKHAIDANSLLILFSFTFFTALYYFAMKDRKTNNNEYIIVQQSETIKGEIV